MINPKFHLEISYNETTGDPVAAYLRIREGKIIQTKEISEGVAFADYGADGLLIGIELLAPCRLAPLDWVSEKEPESVPIFACRRAQGDDLCLMEDVIALCGS